MYSEQRIIAVRHVLQIGFSLYAVCRICIEVMVSSVNTKQFFVKKKKSVHTPSGEYVCTKIDGEQRTVYSSTFALFSQTIFCSAKKGFHLCPVGKQCISGLRLIMWAPGQFCKWAFLLQRKTKVKGFIPYSSCLQIVYSGLKTDYAGPWVNP